MCRVQAREEVMQGYLQEHLPYHVWEASGPGVFAEEPFERGEPGVGLGRGVSCLVSRGLRCSLTSHRPTGILGIFS